MNETMKLIKKSALTVINGNRLLVVRAKGSSYFLMPGGKPKEGESAIAALEREIMEELSCGIDRSSVIYLGNFEELTVDGKARVLIDLYTGALFGEPKPSSEIEELKWISAADAINPFLTPIVKKQILPFLVGRKMLS
ncbi:NUDIX domain-containing protein [Candidatus Woesearchaeota archaeon]|nr:NUDIX domain-containing protein [Candidatus Woesearchaeota archaeon]